MKRFGKNKNNGEAKIASFYGQLFTCFAVMPMVLYGIIKLFPEVEILNELAVVSYFLTGVVFIIALWKDNRKHVAFLSDIAAGKQLRVGSIPDPYLITYYAVAQRYDLLEQAVARVLIEVLDHPQGYWGIRLPRLFSLSTIAREMLLRRYVAWLAWSWVKQGEQKNARELLEKWEWSKWSESDLRLLAEGALLFQVPAEGKSIVDCYCERIKKVFCMKNMLRCMSPEDYAIEVISSQACSEWYQQRHV